jgi:hypothetical protein
MRYISLILLLLLAGCKESELQKKLKSADAITVHFYLNAHSDSVIKILHTNNKDAISKLASFIDDKEINAPDCGRDGAIFFKVKDAIIDTVGFNVLQKSCRQFFFIDKGKEKVTQVSNEAADFLTSMWSGKTYY